jgi:hypothetical protein
MFENFKAHQIIVSIGFMLIGIAWFLPITIDSRLDPTPKDEYHTIDTINYGLVSGIFYLNLFLIAIPLIIGNTGYGVAAQVFIVITGFFALAVIKFGAEFSVFHWGGPISGTTGSGIIPLLIGDIFIIIGSFMTVDFLAKFDR